jgi:hypothetical protein
MPSSKRFDVFLSHNTKDKPTVRELADALAVRGLEPWLDERELVPGRPWQEALEQIIQSTKTAAVLFGPSGLGPWEQPEMRACLGEFIDRNLPVIPVLLPGAPDKPQLPLFLRVFTWVDLRDGLTQDGIDRLVWGITGERPQNAPTDSSSDLLPQTNIDAEIVCIADDVSWATRLSTCLRQQGIRSRVLMSPPVATAQLLERLTTCRKLILVCSRQFLHQEDVNSQIIEYLRENKDVETRDRKILPVLIENCPFTVFYPDLPFLDFRTERDFDLRMLQLTQALDMPAAPAQEQTPGPVSPYPHGWLRHRELRFKSKVAEAYRLHGFRVDEEDAQVSGTRFDLLLEEDRAGMCDRYVVVCADAYISVEECRQILDRWNRENHLVPGHRWIVVSSVGFEGNSRRQLSAVGLYCVMYTELLRQLVPLDQYVQDFVAEYDEWFYHRRGWHGRDRFIQPTIRTESTLEELPALTFLAQWLRDAQDNLLVVLGDLGTGKTTLLRFLAHQLALSFQSDPLRHPAPFVISLGDVRKEVALDSMVLREFRQRNISGVNYRAFEHLLHLGKIVLFLDAFDEMADRVRWDVTCQNFQEVRRAAITGVSKVLLTCRTHYFRDREEQSRLFAQGPSLNSIETALYKQFREEPGSQVIYLREFDTAQVQDYLRLCHGSAWKHDWDRIGAYDLQDLTRRPLLLDMIVTTLDRFRPNEKQNTAYLYEKYTQEWLAREVRKGRVVLNERLKLALRQTDENIVPVFQIYA